MTRSWRIRSYLILLVLVVVIPVTGLLSYTIYSHFQQEVEDANRLTLALAEISAINNERYIESRRSILARIADRPQVQGLDPDNCDPILKDFRDFEAGFTNVVVLDKSGLVVCSAVPMSRQISYADGDNYQQVKKTNAFVVGQPSYGRISKKWILPLAYPITDEQGDFNGLIGAAIDLVSYVPMHGFDALPDGTRAALITQAGTIIAHSHDPQTLVGQSIQNSKLESLINNRASSHEHMRGLQDTNMIVGVHSVPTSDWYAVVSIPLESILAQSFYNTLFHVGLLLLILIVAAVMAYIIARRIEHPIRSIADTANAVASGKLQSRLNPEGPAEIGVVASEFNHMLEARERAEQQLREKADHLRLAMDAANQASWQWDIKADHITCSDNIWALFGLAPEQRFQTYNEFLHYVHPEDRVHVTQAVDQTLATGSPYTCDFRVVWNDGTERWLTSSGQMVTDTAGRPERMLGICMDITERTRSDQQMRYLASHDPLTELVNRREFENRLQIILDRFRYQTGQHAVLYLDLDQFKVVNDTCGHTAGDELLRQLASLLSHNIRETDTLARMGGDEFVVLLTHCPLQKTQQIAEQLRQAILDFHFVWNQHGFKLGVSIGLVPVTDNKLGLEQILSAADAACFIAKDLGRNRVHVHTPDDTALAQHHGQMQWVTRIHNAFNESRFSIYCQAIAPLKSCARQHCELLVRMQDTDDSLIPPMAFIPAAERYGLMPRIDRWMITETFQLLRDEASNQEFDFVCNINLSATSLNDADFLSFIREQFASYRIPPETICFEITETAAITNLRQATLFIDVLKELGCLIALDDFGTGMSSFNYLKNFNIDYLKIDGSFVVDINDEAIDRAMVEAINRIGHIMHIQTIAECVENEQILVQLREMGVDYAQGYAIARPIPFRDFIHNPGPPPYT